MDKIQLAEHIFAFIDPGGRSSCGMIFTPEGVVLVDTTARPVDIQACLRMARITPEDICQVLITHSHSDHTSGISLFQCPVLAHQLTDKRIRKRGTQRSKTRLPSETFETSRSLEIGGVTLEIIHLAGHTPDSSIVWLPEAGVLFAGDLIFEGRYPFLATADVQKLIQALRRLPEFHARVIVPGHGQICDNGEVFRQLEYIQTTWEITSKHIESGDRLKDILDDPDYPRYSDIFYEKLHPWNIKVIYQQIMKARR